MLNIVENVWTVGGPPQTPLGELKSAPPDPIAGGRGLLPLLMKPTPLSAFSLAPNEESWARPCDADLPFSALTLLVHSPERIWPVTILLQQFHEVSME